MSFKSISVSASLCCLPALIAQESPLIVSHGPYLQELTADGVTVLWTTNHPCVGRIEYGIDDFAQTAQTVRHGLVKANTTHHAVRITGLKPGQKYRYRLVNTEIVKFGAYDTTLGKNVNGSDNTFTTLNPAPAEFSFIVTQDIHSQTDKYASLLDRVSLNNAAFVVLNGDIDNDPREEAQIYSGHLDLSVERFAKEKPFVLVRGNHETRGAFARDLFEIYPHTSGQYYYSFSHGGVFFMVLACGEDKQDSHPVYAGINAFDDYRAQQAEWIGRELKSKAAASANYRIVLTHIPPTVNPEIVGERPGYAMTMISEQWAPLFRNGKVDLVISGHTHRQGWQAPDTEKDGFAIFIGSNQEIETIKVTEKALEIDVQSLKDNGRKYQVPKRYRQ
jgi:predicted phosphodiesterase